MQFKLSQRVAAGADAVFAHVGDFRQAIPWARVASCRVHGEGAGTWREVTFADPARGRIVECLLSRDPDTRAISWRLAQAEPAWPVRDCVTTLRVVPVLADVSRLESESRFTPDGLPELALRAWLEDLHQQALDAIRCALRG